MRKIFVVLAVMLFTWSCEKNENNVETLSNLQSKLRHIVDLEVKSIPGLSPGSIVNKYDSWGGDIVLVLMEYQDIMNKTDKNNLDLLSLMGIMPTSLKNESLQNIDTKKVEGVINEVLRLFLNREISDAILLSFEMERILILSRAISGKERELILKMTAMIRHLSHYYAVVGDSITKSDYESCWRRKLLELQEAGIFTRLSCVSTWPVCFAALALDCLVEMI